MLIFFFVIAVNVYVQIFNSEAQHIFEMADNILFIL